jgi:hypothetical protein
MTNPLSFNVSTLFLTIIALPTLANAQDASLPQQSQLDSQAGFVGSGISLNSTSDTTNVAVAIGRKWDGFEGLNYSDNNVTLKFSTPITSKENKSGQFVTSSGLADDTSVEIALTRRFWEGVNNLPSLERRSEIIETGLIRCESIAERLKDKEKEKACRAGNLDQNARIHLTAVELKELLGTSRRDSRLFLYGISGTLGINSFEYRDVTTFEKQDSDKTSYNVSAFFGYAPKNQPLYYGAGIQHKLSYKNQDNQTLCQDPTVTPLECFTSPFSPPKKNKDFSVFALVRGQTSVPAFGSINWPIGAELKLAYDFEDDVFGVSLPVYLASDSKGNLQSGVRLDWEDKDDRDIVFGVFVSSKFGIFDTP